MIMDYEMVTSDSAVANATPSLISTGVKQAASSHEISKFSVNFLSGRYHLLHL